MIVSHYGLHTAGGIPFLVQPNGGQNLISPSLQSPFRPVIRPRTARCPHDIKLGQQAAVPLWADEPLAQAFWPTPVKAGEPARLLYAPDADVLETLNQLARLASPTGSLVQPIWWRPPKEIAHVYGLTNLGPLVWTSANAENFGHVRRHIELAQAYQRRIVIVATARLPLFEGVEKVETFTLPSEEPLETIGATLLRQHMEKIQNG